MGIKLFSSGRSCESTPTTPTAPNPNPYRYKLVHVEVFAKAVVVVAKYPDCTTHDGMKVLVYRKEAYEKLTNKMDPHFLEDDTSPFARFEPTNSGLAMAVTVAEALT